MSKLRNEFAKVRKQYLYEFDISSCEKCCKGNTTLHVHHKKALADGGTNEIDNLVALCSRCHHEWHEYEGMTTFEEFMQAPPRIIYYAVIKCMETTGDTYTGEQIKILIDQANTVYKTFNSINALDGDKESKHELIKFLLQIKESKTRELQGSFFSAVIP